LHFAFQQQQRAESSSRFHKGNLATSNSNFSVSHSDRRDSTASVAATAATTMIAQCQPQTLQRRRRRNFRNHICDGTTSLPQQYMRPWAVLSNKAATPAPLQQHSDINDVLLTEPKRAANQTAASFIINNRSVFSFQQLPLQLQQHADSTTDSSSLSIML
jgi:hypothetical protein